ncbi:cysteine proteinase inhibitor 6 [Phtheirospermum japonicum]|uniref:Cysteine proteinase inhibitor 6 n=1 Tax=Phtheirospermum japonicum TaxID=374723 RepID=A0A830D0C8_9LAMI|nr:cysteine proteinase inhibitor 6 [Phtheirospermum japonicum]
MAAFKSLSFPLAILTIWIAFYLFQVAASAAVIGGSKILGDWKPIKNLTDPSVVKIANFAVAEHNQQPKATKLEFVSITKGERQVVAGFNYKLLISAKESGAESTEPDYYSTTVYERIGGKLMKLISFQKLLKN